MTTQEKFWQWFLKHEDKLFDFELDQERVFDRLAAQLQKVDKNLTFELGPKRKSREFVISAAGIKSSFPAVVALANAAPALARWQVTPFRPRRAGLNLIEFRGKKIDPADVQFSLLDNGRTAGLYIYLPGFREGDRDLGQIAYLLLDEALGEYDVEMRLGLIKMFPTESPGDLRRYPLHELPVLFDELVARLEGRSGHPS